MLKLTTLKNGILLFYVGTAFLTGLLVDYHFGNQLDYWIHDSAIVFQHRTKWTHSGIVTLDDGVPYSVGRKQALPLFARAAERLIEAGAKGVFLDTRIAKVLEGRMPYARCIDKDGFAQWSMPECNASTNKQCQINNSDLGSAPLKMDKLVIESFQIAPYLEDNNLPDFLLYGWEAAEAIPADGLEASDRLVTFDSSVARWLDLSEDHAVYKLVGHSQAKNASDSYKSVVSDQLCDDSYPCRRIRLSVPSYKTNTQEGKLILPVSILASCDINIARQTAALLKDKVVVLQTTAPGESTDLVVTPMTTAFFGPKLMTPGAQFLVDGVETLLNNDAPQPPAYPIKILLFACVALISVLAGQFLRYLFVWGIGFSIFIALSALCFVNPIIQLWPVVAAMLVYLLGAGQMLAVQLMMGVKQGRLVRQYIPDQVYSMLISLRQNELFKIRRCHVVVLMSDLAGYTTVTGLLKEPRLVLELMNDYLEETSYVLQNKYHGILESYVGDMVCYYWKQESGQSKEEMYQNALLGAIDLRLLQKQFFLTLQQRYTHKVDTESLQRIHNIIDAGIGVTVGNVVMGDLGPRHGIKKFGILGDPLNLAARIESLTRLFSTDIIIAGDFLGAVENSGLSIRRLGAIKVKGRVLPKTLYALGCPDDPLFEKENIKRWVSWLEELESGIDTKLICPDCYQKDQNTIHDWLSRGLLGDDGIWCLDEK